MDFFCHTDSVAFEATLGTLYRWADKVLRLDDTPPRLAAAYALGIVAGFSPFFVVSYVVAFAAAFVLRLNKLLVLAGLCTNLPWIMVGGAAEGVTIDTRTGFGYASAQAANRVVKFSLTDWRPVLEIATDASPDPVEVLQLRSLK